MGFIDRLRRRRSRPPACRYPIIRAELLKRCRNPEETTALLARKSVHPIERALLSWGRTNLLELIRHAPLSEGTDRESLGQRDGDGEITDSLSTYFRLFASLVDWGHDPARRELVLRHETYVTGSDGEFRFEEKELRELTLKVRRG